MYTQPGDFAGDTEDDEMGEHGYPNGNVEGDTEDDEVQTEEDEGHYPPPGKTTGWTANRFGALADAQEYENGYDSQDSQEQQSVSEGHAAEDGRGLSVSVDDERDGTDGDIEYDSEEEDEEEFDEDEEDDMDQQIGGHFASYHTAPAPAPAPVKNEALQSVGNTQEEAIELSD